MTSDKLIIECYNFRIHRRYQNLHENKSGIN